MMNQDLEYSLKMNRLAREVSLNMRNEECEGWTFSVKKLEKVPTDYLQVNEYNIKLAIKNGLRDIPGLEIYKTQRKTK